MRRVVFVLFFFVPLISIAQNAYKAEVMAEMVKLKNSLIEKDSIALSNILDETVTYGHTNGMIETKDQLIHSVMTGVQDYKNIGMEEMEVKVYERTAIVTMKSKVSMNYKEKLLDLNMFAMLVWIKKNEVWKLVARQNVKLNQ